MGKKVHINSEIIEEICEKINSDAPLNYELPKNGWLHIDKFLPFICIYRFKEPDVYFSRLLKTQASYLIIDETIDITKLLEAIRLIISEKFDTFLVLEVWPDVKNENTKFNINCPENVATETAIALKEGFSKLANTYPNVSANIHANGLKHPKHLQPIADVETSKKTGMLLIGVEVPVLYKNSETGELYSLFFREFYSVFSETIKRAVYEFIRVQTKDDFDNYLMLGKTHIDEITTKADAELASISEGMSFLLRTTPVNSNEEWEKFKENKFKKIPSFKYRLISIDPE